MNYGVHCIKMVYLCHFLENKWLDIAKTAGQTFFASKKGL